MPWLLTLAFGVLLLLTLTQSRRPLAGKTWTYLRCLFPSWRFFESVEPGPELELRVEGEDSGTAPWLPALSPAGPPGFFLNAEGNLRLAYQSLAQQLLNELDGVEVTAAPALASYRLVQRLVEERARTLGLGVARASYRFRLRSGSEVDFESGAHSFE